MRRAARRLPAPVRHAIRRLLRFQPFARGRKLTALPPLPNGVADEAEVRNFLLSNAAVFGSEAEAQGYLEDALTRFRVTMALLPPLAQGASVLELGANPYFLTRLLRRRSLDIVCANWFGQGHYTSGRGMDEIPGPAGDEVFEFDHFNVEEDQFPYPDDSFELVLFCEILEHLPADPVHALAEIHRVLRPGGFLVLTTPNATRTDRLAAMLRGENVYEHLSGYGTYGRHNRLYTAAELGRLLAALGYEVEKLMALDVHQSETISDWPRQASVDYRGDNLFCVARAVGEARWCYPRWLFQSVHGLYGKRIVRPDLKVGSNDDLQSAGLSDPDQNDPDVRWSSDRPARVLLAPDFSGPGELVVEGVRSPMAAGETRLLIKLPSRGVELCVPYREPRFRVTAPARATRGRMEIELSVVGPPVGIQRIALVPAGRQ
jgi:SAM-dependent methyltransferase